MDRERLRLARRDSGVAPCADLRKVFKRWRLSPDLAGWARQSIDYKYFIFKVFIRYELNGWGVLLYRGTPTGLVFPYACSISRFASQITTAKTAISPNLSPHDIPSGEDPWKRFIGSEHDVEIPVLHRGRSRADKFCRQIRATNLSRDSWGHP